jgi:hypothetical protein
VILEFSDAAKYAPNMSAVPDKYLGVSFDTLELEAKAVGFLSDYLREFSYEGKQGLLLYPGEMACKTLVAVYREVASRVTAESARFLDWVSYAAGLRALGWRAEDRMLEDLFEARFVFIMGLGVRTEDAGLLWALFDHCTSSNVRLLVSTREAKILEKLPEGLGDALGMIVTAVKMVDKHVG